MKSPYALIIECSHHVRNTGLDKVSSHRKMMGAGKPLRFFRDPAVSEDYRIFRRSCSATCRELGIGASTVSMHRHSCIQQKKKENFFL